MLTNKRPSSPGQGALDVVIDTELVTTPATTSIVSAEPAETNATGAAEDEGEHDMFAWHGPLWEHQYGDYIVKTIRGPEFENDSILQIFKGGTLIYSNSSHSFNEPEAAPPPDAGGTTLIPPSPGANITGNGIPNLVISSYSGGAHCCSTYHIFELGDEFRVVDTIYAGHGEAVFADVDGDGIPEIQVQEWGYAYAFASFADSPAPDIILRYADGKYRVATELMFTEAPTAEEFTAMVTEINTIYAKAPSGSDEPIQPGEWGSEPILWKEMLDLAYKGHVDLALKLFNTCWQADWKNQTTVSDTFWNQVAQSQYGRAVVEAQGFGFPEVKAEEGAAVATEE